MLSATREWKMTDGPEQAMRVAMRVREAVVAVGTKEIAWGSGSLRPWPAARLYGAVPT